MGQNNDDNNNSVISCVIHHLTYVQTYAQWQIFLCGQRCLHNGFLSWLLWSSYLRTLVSWNISYSLKLRRHLIPAQRHRFLLSFFFFSQMESPSLDVREQFFLSITVPLFFFNLIGNSFFAYCLIFSKLKQPLKLLLELLVCCAIAFLAQFCFFYPDLVKENEDMFTGSWVGLRLIVHSTVACFVWLSFYYYIQIVPSQKTLQLWIKRNIRPFIYIALLLEEIFILFHGTIDAATWIIPTSYWNSSHTEHSGNALYTSSQVIFIINKLHLLGCLSIMSVSNFSTVHYLYKHMKRVALDSFCTPKMQSQMRATIAGISQYILFLFYFIYFSIDSITYRFFSFVSLGPFISLAFSFLYMSGTTVNLAMGQTIFRQRAANVWKALCGGCKVSNDVKMQTSQ